MFITPGYYFHPLTHQRVWGLECSQSTFDMMIQDHMPHPTVILIIIFRVFFIKGFRGQLGGGLVHYGGSKYGSSGTWSDSNQSNVQAFNMNVEFDNKVKPFLTLGVELSKTLKNEDLLSLRVSYDHSFDVAYSGTYSINNQNSTGLYFNKGNFLNVHLGYTLTQSKRRNEIKQIQMDSTLNLKAARKISRKKRRNIDPKSYFINLSGGIGVGATRVSNDPNGILQNYGFPSFIPRLSFEKGIGKQFYWEAGYHSQLFWDVQRFSFNKYYSSGSSAFYAYQLSGGILYRWILPTSHYNIINVHSGLSLGYQGQNNSGYQMGSGTMNGMVDNATYSFSYAYTMRYKSNILASVYLGLSKDFKIVNNFYLSLNYRQQFGLFKVTESTYTYQGLNIPYTTGATTKINGSSRDFQLGFKYKFLSKKN
jgi:hypothetical protein